MTTEWKAVDILELTLRRVFRLWRKFSYSSWRESLLVIYARTCIVHAGGGEVRHAVEGVDGDGAVLGAAGGGRGRGLVEGRGRGQGVVVVEARPLAVAAALRPVLGARGAGAGLIGVPCSQQLGLILELSTNLHSSRRRPLLRPSTY